MKHIFAFRAPLKRHDSEANFKLKKEKKNTVKNKHYRVAAWSGTNRNYESREFLM